MKILILLFVTCILFYVYAIMEVEGSIVIKKDNQKKIIYINNIESVKNSNCSNCLENQLGDSTQFNSTNNPINNSNNDLNNLYTALDTFGNLKNNDYYEKQYKILNQNL